MEKLTLQQHSVLEPPPVDWFAQRCAVTHDGHLVRLSTTVDVIGRWRARYRAARDRPRAGAVPDSAPSGDALPSDPITPPGVEALIEVFDAEQQYRGPIFAFDMFHPLLDRFGDGCWILAEARSSGNEKNARLLGADGATLDRFSVGDGLNHLQCDARDGIWVGYFDEGVYSNNRLGEWGLNRFGRDGALQWRFDPSAFTPPVVIDDCYALNVMPDQTWCCTYTDFPIVRITSERDTRWRNSVAGAKALAVQFPYVLLVGGYGTSANRGVLLRLEGEDASIIREFGIHFPGGAALTGGSSIFGRGDSVHVVENHAWYRLRLADLR